MSLRTISVCLLLTMIASSIGVAGQSAVSGQGAGAADKALASQQKSAARPSPAARTNPEIRRIVREISPANIKAIIEKLVTFKTRHTLSETESETVGIGAARRWIKSEMERYSKESGGRLQVAFDEYTQEKSNRVPNPVQVVNVVGTLPGAQSESQDRYYVISGHYDSRASNGNDAKIGRAH